MKARELAEQLLKNPDFDIAFVTVDSPVGFGYNIRKFRNIGIADIGYSDKIIRLDGTELQM